MVDLDDTLVPAGVPAGESEAEAGRYWLPLLLVLFTASGCAALIYEIVWFQLLQLSIGSSAVSLGVLLGIYMGGMCLGSLLVPRFMHQGLHPLKVYALLELGIGLFGLIALVGVPAVGDLYTRIAGTGPVSLIMRAFAASICLVPPTLLMGATLPVAARWVETAPTSVSWWGFLYAANLCGAVVGSLLAGFYLLRVFDMPTATAVAVALNIAIALVAFGLSRVADYSPASRFSSPVGVLWRDWMVYTAIALSGLTALGAEVVWTRNLSLLFGGTTYTFSLILAVFLVGLGVGSTMGSSIARAVKSPQAALGWCQLLLCATMAWGAYTVGTSMPFWPINPQISTNPIFNFQLDLMRCIWVVMPAALLWGASFPLALASVARRGEDPGRLVGQVYAANTVGAIVGALVTSLVLVGLVGTQTTQRLLISVSAFAGMLMVIPAVSRPGRRGAAVRPYLVLGAVAFAAGLLMSAVPPVPALLVAYGRYAATWVGINEILYVGEGRTASVAVSRTPYGVLNYHNAGKVQASSEPQDMRLQRMLGHLTTLVPRNPARVLVIGCGAGVTAGAVSIDPLVKGETIAEIEPLVPEAAATHFGQYNFNVVRNPKVTIHLDDARHYLLTTNEKFDAITSDPLDPWVKGAATLYTREFFNVVKTHLNPGGIVTLFVQLYESSEDAVKSEVATFLDAFPGGAVFANLSNGLGYDVVLVGQLEQRPINVDAVQARLVDPANAAVAKSLSEVTIFSAVDLFGTYAGRAADMTEWLKGAQINLDRNLRLQYLAGLGLNLNRSDEIYRHMSAARRYPDDLFEGSPETIAALRAKIGAGSTPGGTPSSSN